MKAVAVVQAVVAAVGLAVVAAVGLAVVAAVVGSLGRVESARAYEQGSLVMLDAASPAGFYF